MMMIAVLDDELQVGLAEENVPKVITIFTTLMPSKLFIHLPVNKQLT